MTGRDAGQKHSSSVKLKIFISYSRKDEAFAQELLSGLEVAGFEAYIDTHDIAAGEAWEERLDGLIGAADTVVFVVSPDSVTSKRCEWEVARAEKLGKRLLPVVFRRVDNANTPERLKRLNYIFFDKPFSFGVSLAQLAKSLNTDLDWIREHTRIGELAARWDSRGRGEALLIRGADLADVKDWMRRPPKDAPEPTQLQQEFIAESERAQAAQDSRELEQQRQLRQAEVERERLAREKAEEQAAAADKLAREASRTASRTRVGLIASLGALGMASYFGYTADLARKQALESEARAISNEERAVANEQAARAAEGKAKQRRYEALLRLKEAQREKRRATEAIKAASATAEKLLDDVAKAITASDDAPEKQGWEGRIINHSDELLSQLVVFDTGSEGLELQRIRTRLTRSLMMARGDKPGEARDETLEALKMLDEVKSRVTLAGNNEAWLLRTARYIGRELEARKKPAEALGVLEAVLSRSEDVARRYASEQARSFELMQVQFAVGEARRAAKLPEKAKDIYLATIETGTRMFSAKQGTLQSVDLTALAHERTGDLLSDAKDVPGARSHYERSAALDAMLVKEKPDDVRFTRNLTIAQDRYLKSLRQDIKLGRSDEALRAARAQITAIERRLAVDKAASEDGRRSVRVMLAEAHDRLGSILNDRGDYKGGLAAHESYLAQARTLAAEAPDDAARMRSVMWAHAALRNTRQLARDFTGALANALEQARIADLLTKDGSRGARRTSMLAMRQAAEAHINIGQIAEARDLAQKSFAIAGALAGEPGLSETDAAAAKLELAKAHGELASVGIDVKANLAREVAIADELAKSGKVSAADLSGLRVHVSFAGLFAREFDFVIGCCVEPGQPISEATLRMNKAHALAFRGRTEEARRIYMADVNRRHLMWGFSTWEGAVLTDFAQFRGAGLGLVPLMTEVEAAYTASFANGLTRDPGTGEPGAPSPAPAAAPGAASAGK